MAITKELMTDAMVVPLSVDQYHRMIDAGVLTEGSPVELLDGMLIRKDRSRAGDDPMTVGHHHAGTIDQLTALSGEIREHGAKLRIQQPVTFAPLDEPEPDAAIVAPASYRDNHPGPADILCLIEVADSSIRHDQTTKQRIYASFGVPQYVIINLAESVIEVYRQPEPSKRIYGSRETIGRADLLMLDMKPRLMRIAAASLLP